jgi:hypothetical protein
MSLTTTDLVTMFGANYKKGTLTLQDLVTKFYQKTKTDEVFKVIPTVNTVEHMSKMAGTRVLQLFQKVNTPIGGLTFTPRAAQLTQLKIDAEEYPDDITKTAVGFLSDIDVNDRKNWPIIRLFIEAYLIPQSQEDWELLEVYKGVSASITTPGTANAAGYNFVGLRKQINDFVTAGKLDNSTTITGNFSFDGKTFVEQVEAWIRLCKERSAEDRILWESGQIKEICMAPEWRDLFKVGMGEKYNTHYSQVNLNGNLNVDDNVTVQNSSVKIVGLPSMIGDDVAGTGDAKLFAAPTFNKYGFIKRPKSETMFEVTQGTNARQVFMYADYWKAVGFWMPEYIYTNDNDL